MARRNSRRIFSSGCKANRGKAQIAIRLPQRTARRPCTRNGQSLSGVRSRESCGCVVPCAAGMAGGCGCSIGAEARPPAPGPHACTHGMPCDAQRRHPTRCAATAPPHSRRHGTTGPGRAEPGRVQRGQSARRMGCMRCGSLGTHTRTTSRHYGCDCKPTGVLGSTRTAVLLEKEVVSRASTKISKMAEGKTERKSMRNQPARWHKQTRNLPVVVAVRDGDCLSGS